MEYGVRYSILGSQVVSPVSDPDIAKAVAESWSRSIHPDATAVYRRHQTDDWFVLKDSDTAYQGLPIKEG